jgi:hypothetical protein
VFEANGTAERHVALVMPEQIPGTKKVTVAGDKAYETANFVAECRNLKITPQVAQNLGRSGARMADTTVVDTNASTPGLCCNRAQLGSLLAILFEFCVQALNRAPWWLAPPKSTRAWELRTAKIDLHRRDSRSSQGQEHWPAYSHPDKQQRNKIGTTWIAGSVSWRSLAH